MKYIFSILLILASFALHATVEVAPDTFRVGKINVTYHHNSKDETAFKNAVIATITDNYLKKSTTIKEYKSLPLIELRLYYSDKPFLKSDIAMRDSKIYLTVVSSSNLAANTLKQVDYVVNHLSKLTEGYAEACGGKPGKYIRGLIDADIYNQIISSPLNKKMEKCLSTRYYREKDNFKPKLHSNNNRTLFSFENDNYYFSNSVGDLVLTLPNIEQIFTLKELGFLIFDTDSSFYHYYRPLLITPENEKGVLSKRHIIENSNHNLSNHGITDKDFINKRITITCMGKRIKYRYYDRHETRKFLYLIEEDILISDYQDLENNFINEIKNNYR